ncbi:MAG: amidase [Proteobacteria bacterium]|nr:MAG: amidase [Pseudomonadota bacterium]
MSTNPTPQSNFRITEATIAGAHEAMMNGELTARALVDAYRARIDAYDQRGPTINAIITINDAAGARADALDAEFAVSGKLSGPLHGIPILVKDNIETAAMPTTQGCIGLAEFQPTVDATVIQQLESRGAIILGKTTLPDFATSWWAYSSLSGNTRNPYALECDPGGSSAGSGAAVAANFAMAALGTDCGGSVRVPSSFDNLVGIRSTPGLISRNGAATLVFFQDTIGPMTRSVTDAARVFDALVGYDPADSLTAHYLIARVPATYTEFLDVDGLKGRRIGLVTNALGADDDPHSAPVNRVVRAALDSIRVAGAEVIEIQIPDLSQHIVATSMYVNCSKYEINEFLMARPAAAMRSLQQIVEQQRYHPMLDLIEACVRGPEMPEYDPLYYRRLAAREEFARTVINVMGGAALDALVYPSVQVVPPTREQLDARMWTTLTFPTNTLIGSQTWMPSATVPAGFTEAGLPVGLEFLVKPYAEASLFALAYAFEQATQHRRAPSSTPAL